MLFSVLLTQISTNTYTCVTSFTSEDTECFPHHKKFPCANFQSVLHPRSNHWIDFYHRRRVFYEILKFYIMTLYTMFFCVVWLFHSVYHFWDSYMLFYAYNLFLFCRVIFHCINISQFCLSIFLLMNIWLLSSVSLLWEKLLWTFFHKIFFVDLHVFISLG